MVFPLFFSIYAEMLGTRSCGWAELKCHLGGVRDCPLSVAYELIFSYVSFSKWSMTGTQNNANDFCAACIYRLCFNTCSVPQGRLQATGVFAACSWNVLEAHFYDNQKGNKCWQKKKEKYPRNLVRSGSGGKLSINQSLHLWLPGTASKPWYLHT